MTQVFRYDVEDVRNQALIAALAAVAEHAKAAPVDRMRAWLSDVAHGEFDAVPPERVEH